MPKRRGNKEGSIYQDKDGIWFAQLSPDEFGKRQKRRAKSQKEARALLREMQQEREKGLDLSRKTYTIEEFGQTWLAEVVKPTVKATTFQSYEWIFSRYIVAHLGKLKLAAVSPAHIQRFVNALGKTYAPETVRNAYRRLRAMLDTAVVWRLIPYNPAIGVRLPAITNKRRKVWTAEEARRFLEAAQQLYPRLYALFCVLIYIGLRKGEGSGLCSTDINWQNQTISINQQVRMLGYKTTVIPSLKTEGSERVLPVASRLLDILRDHIGRLEEEKRVFGWDTDLLFVSEAGTAINPNNLHRAYKKIIQAAGVPDIRIHDLRHTFATLLGELGIEERIITEILGHTPKSITAHYTQVSQSTMREALERLAALL